MYILALILLGRLVLPYFLKYQINSSLANIQNKYSGKIEDLSISLLDSSIQIESFELINLEGKSSKFLSIRDLEVEILWKKLFNKAIYLNLNASGLDLYLDQSNEKEEETEESDEHWTRVFDRSIPIYINDVSVSKSKVSFTSLNINNMKNIDINIDQLHAKELIILNREKKTLPKISGSGNILKILDFKLDGGLDLTKSPLPIDLDLIIEKFNLTSINKTLMSYIPINITTGKMYLAGEIKGTTEKARGYAKIFFHNLDIVESNQNYVSVDHIAIEWLSGLTNWILQFITDPTISIKVPFDINNEIELDTSEAFWSAINNEEELSKEIDGI